MIRYILTGLVFLLILFGIPEPAYADNCGSLSDCYGVAVAAAIAGVAIPILISLLLDFSPFGRAKGIIEAILGRDLITGDKLAWWERLLNLIPGGRTASKVTDTVDAVEDLARAARRAASVTDEAADLSRSGGKAANAIDAAEGSYTKLSQPGGLSATEGMRIRNANGNLGPPSHPLGEHGPNKPLSVADGPNSVEQRVIDGKPKATKFTDRANMETAIGRTINARQADIDAWLKTNPPAGVNKPFDHSSGLGNLGEGYYRTQLDTVEKIPDNLENVRVIIKSDGNGGYVIQSAFPHNDPLMF